MTEPQSALDEFRIRLQADWLPAFANDAKRKYGVAGFQENSIQLSESDAANFLRAMDGSLVVDRGGGRYQCAQSRASEQLFWEGAKGQSLGQSRSGWNRSSRSQRSLDFTTTWAGQRCSLDYRRPTMRLMWLHTVVPTGVGWLLHARSKRLGSK